MSARIEAHIVKPHGLHQATIIWLHGLGADGFDFAPIVPDLDLNKQGVKFIFPHAPIRPITINNGYPMRGWYDIVTLDPDSFQDDMPGIRGSAQYVEELIADEIQQGIDPLKIIVVGFSQGGAIALFAGLTSSIKIGGIIALSTYLPANEIVALEQQMHCLPILMIHGSHDQTISLKYAEQSRDFLLKMSCKLEFEVYPMGHTLCQEELIKISQWLKDKL